MLYTNLKKNTFCTYLILKYPTRLKQPLHIATLKKNTLRPRGTFLHKHRRQVSDQTAKLTRVHAHACRIAGGVAALEIQRAEDPKRKERVAVKQ